MYINLSIHTTRGHENVRKRGEFLHILGMMSIVLASSTLTNFKAEFMIMISPLGPNTGLNVIFLKQ